MSEPTRRALRTLCQTAPAGVIVGTITAFVAWTPQQVAAVTSLLTVLFALGYNLLEDSGMYVPVKRTN